MVRQLHLHQRRGDGERRGTRDLIGAKINFVPDSAIGLGVHLTLAQGLRATLTAQSYSGIYSDIKKDDPNKDDDDPLDGYVLVNARIQYGTSAPGTGTI